MPTTPEVDLTRLSEMLNPLYPEHRIVSAELVSGGFANASYKVALAHMAAPIVVRVYLRDPSAAYREASILELVSERVPVPEILYVSPAACEPHTYIIIGWVAGVPLDDALTEAPRGDARVAVRSTGGVLARLQEFRFATSGFFGSTLDVERPVASDTHAIVGVLERCLFEDVGEERLGVTLSQRLWQFVKEHEQSLAAVEHHSLLVHGDFNGANVIVRTAPEPPGVSALIDWEYAHSGTPLVDLGGILRGAASRPAWFEEELIRGYREEGGVLPENWRQVSRIVDLVKLCAFVRSPNAGDVAVEGVRAIVETTLSEENR
jgi:aminoglycoside phosphotransferase (APT) family kinase protein